MVTAYQYRGMLYCQDCGERMIRKLVRESKIPLDCLATVDVKDSETLTLNFNSSMLDSERWPIGPLPQGGGEADAPQYCGSGSSCLHVETVGGLQTGLFLENPLTEDGKRFVLDLHKRPSTLTQRWMEFYGLEEETP